ncbi:MAG TPA: hypothetical protein VF593_01510 [Chthoniobacteraceae bacterium]
MGCCPAQESDSIRLDFPKSDVADVLAIYERLGGAPVFASLDLKALVTVQTSEPVSRAAALQLIRKTLLERYGIAIREVDQSTILAGWSKDPLHPRRSDEPMTDDERKSLREGQHSHH